VAALKALCVLAPGIPQLCADAVCGQWAKRKKAKESSGLFLVLVANWVSEAAGHRNGHRLHCSGTAQDRSNKVTHQ
jgi:hypothetical protein